MTAGSPVRAYIGLGSNLGRPAQQIRRASAELGALPETRLERASSLYVSAPLGPPGQPDYVNAVAALCTGLPPLRLLDELQAIECRHGRVRGERWGSRTLDLDLLLYGERVIDSPRLTVPHPHLAERRFVLQPLHEVAPGLRLPDGRPVADLLAQCPPWEIRKLAP